MTDDRPYPIEPPEPPVNHVKPGFCCLCGDGPKLFGHGADTSRYRRCRFVLSDDVVTTMAFCVDCAPRAGENVADLRDQLLDGWWQALHGRAYRQVGSGWKLVQVRAQFSPDVVAREWPRCVTLAQGMALDLSYFPATYEEVDATEGILHSLSRDA